MCKILRYFVDGERCVDISDAEMLLMHRIV